MNPRQSLPPDDVAYLRQRIEKDVRGVYALLDGLCNELLMVNNDEFAPGAWEILDEATEAVGKAAKALNVNLTPDP
jgi:hypothetical protein